MNTTAITNTIGAHLGSRSTGELFEMLALIESATMTADDRTVRNWIHEAIEARHDVAAAMDAWADDVETGLTYSEALAAAVKTVAA